MKRISTELTVLATAGGCADDTKVVTETNEANNCKASVAKVTSDRSVGERR